MGKLNLVEADRLAQAGVVLSKAIRSCKGVEGLGEATLVAEEGARVGQQLAEASVGGWTGEGWGYYSPEGEKVGDRPDPLGPSNER